MNIEQAAAGSDASVAARSSLRNNYRESVPLIKSASGTPLPLPLVNADGDRPGDRPAVLRSDGSHEYPDILIHEAWLSEMTDRVTTNKKQELFSKAMFGDTLLSYQIETAIEENDVHAMWRQPHRRTDWFKHETLYECGITAPGVERLYRGLYTYAVGFSVLVHQVTADLPEKDDLVVKLLSFLMALQFEVYKADHGDDVATRCWDHFEKGVYDKLATYDEALAICRQHEAEMAGQLQELQISVAEKRVNDIERKNMKQKLQDMQQRMVKMANTHFLGLKEAESKTAKVELLLREAFDQIRNMSTVIDRERDLRADATAHSKAEVELLLSKQERLREVVTQMHTEMLHSHSAVWDASAIAGDTAAETVVSEDQMAGSHSKTLAIFCRMVLEERAASEKKQALSTNDQSSLISHLRNDIEQLQHREIGFGKELRSLKDELFACEELNSDVLVKLASTVLRLDRQTSVARYNRRTGRRVLVHLVAQVMMSRHRLRQKTGDSQQSEAEIEVLRAQLNARNAALLSAKSDYEGEIARQSKANTAFIKTTRTQFATLSTALHEARSALVDEASVQRYREEAQNKHKDLYAEIEGMRLTHARELSARDDEVARLAAEMKAMRADREEVDEQLRQLRARGVSMVARASLTRSRLEKNLVAANNVLAGIERDGQGVEATLQKQTQLADHARKELERTKKAAAAQAAQFEETRGEAVTQLREVEVELARTQTVSTTFVREAAEAEHNMQLQLDTVQANNDELMEENDKLKREQERLSDEMGLLNSEVAELESGLYSSREETVAARKNCAQLQKIVSGHNQSATVTKTITTKQQDDKDDLQGLYEASQDEIAQLMMEVETQRKKIIADAITLSDMQEDVSVVDVPCQTIATHFDLQVKKTCDLASFFLDNSWVFSDGRGGFPGAESRSRPCRRESYAPRAARHGERVCTNRQLEAD